MKRILRECYVHASSATAVVTVSHGEIDHQFPSNVMLDRCPTRPLYRGRIYTVCMGARGL